MSRAWPRCAAWLLLCCAGCLNPKPEEFPSAQLVTPGDSAANPDDNLSGDATDPPWLGEDIDGSEGDGPPLSAPNGPDRDVGGADAGAPQLPGTPPTAADAGPDAAD